MPKNFAKVCIDNYLLKRKSVLTENRVNGKQTGVGRWLVKWLGTNTGKICQILMA